MHVCSTGHFYVYPIVPVLSLYVLRFDGLKKKNRYEKKEVKEQQNWFLFFHLLDVEGFLICLLLGKYYISHSMFTSAWVMDNG